MGCVFSSHVVVVSSSRWLLACVQKRKRDCNPTILVRKKPGRLASQEPPHCGGGAVTCTSAEEFQPPISKKRKKDSGRHFGWPFWPMQAGPGRPPKLFTFLSLLLFGSD